MGRIATTRPAGKWVRRNDSVRLAVAEYIGRRLTQAEICERVGISRATYYRLKQEFEAMKKARG